MTVTAGCCCTPCERYQGDYEIDDSFAITGVTVGDTTGWEVSGGTLNLTNSAGDSLTYTVPVESTPRAFSLRVAYDVLDLGEDSGGVFMWIGAKLVALYKSNGGDILLVYGSESLVLGTYNGSGTRVVLQVNPSDCGTAIRAFVEYNLDRTIRTFAISLADFGSPTDIDMGVIGLPGPAVPTDDTDCCPTDGWPSSMSAAGSLSGGSTGCSPDSCSVTGAQTLTSTTTTLDGGAVVPVGDRYWRGNVPISGLAGGTEMVVWCDGGTPKAFLIDGSGVSTQDLTLVSSACNAFQLVFDVPTSECCLDGVIPTKRITLTSSGAGSPTNSFDNADFLACGTLPVDECDGLASDVCGEEPRPPVEPIISDVYKIEETGGYLVGGSGAWPSHCVAVVGISACWVEYTLNEPTAPCPDGTYISAGANPYVAYTYYDSGTSEIAFRVRRNLDDPADYYEYRIPEANNATGFTVAMVLDGAGAYTGTQLNLTPKRFGEE